MWSGGLCCTVQYEKASLAQSLSEYFIHIRMYWVHREELYVSRGRNYMICSYLRLGMRYESEIWNIVISMNRAFKWCQFCCELNFDPKSWKTMDYSLCLSVIFGKMWPSSIITFKTLLESSFDADHNGRTQVSYLNHTLRYNLSSLGQW